jgi:hypothetical protein
MNDLRHGEPLEEQVVPVERRARPDLETRLLRPLQRLHQLIEKERHPRVDICLGLRRPRSCRDSFSATRDDLIAVGRDEFVKHGTLAFIWERTPVASNGLSDIEQVDCRSRIASLCAGPRAHPPPRACPLESPAAPPKALARITSAVAHDLRNVFTVIKGSVDFALRQEAGSPVHDELTDIREATSLGNAIIEQLSTLGGRQRRVTVVDVNDAVRDARSVLERLLRPGLVWRRSPRLCVTREGRSRSSRSRTRERRFVSGCRWLRPRAIVRQAAERRRPCEGTLGSPRGLRLLCHRFAPACHRERVNPHRVSVPRRSWARAPLRICGSA